MPLVIISIPLMILAVGLAAIPLLVMSHRVHTERAEPSEQREHALALIEARQGVANGGAATSDPTSDTAELPLAA